MNEIRNFVKTASAKGNEIPSFLMEDVQELISKGDVRIFVEQNLNEEIQLKLFTRPNEAYGGGPILTGDVMHLKGNEFMAKKLVTDLRSEGYKAKFIYSYPYFKEKLQQFALKNDFHIHSDGYIEGPSAKIEVRNDDYSNVDEDLLYSPGSKGNSFSWNDLKGMLINSNWETERLAKEQFDHEKYLDVASAFYRNIGKEVTKITKYNNDIKEVVTFSTRKPSRNVIQFFIKTTSHKEKEKQLWEKYRGKHNTPEFVCYYAEKDAIPVEEYILFFYDCERYEYEGKPTYSKKEIGCQGNEENLQNLRLAISMVNPLTGE